MLPKYLNNNIKIVFILLFLGIVSKGFAQDAIIGYSSIQLNFQQYNDKDSIKSLYPFLCKVTQMIYKSDKELDSLTLELAAKTSFSFYNSIFYQNISVQSVINQNFSDIEYQFRNNQLSIKCDHVDTMKIEYYFQPDYFLYGNADFLTFFVPYQSSWQSYYFTNNQLCIKNIEINIPNKVLYFMDKKKKHGSNSIDIMDSNNSVKEGLSIFLLDSQYYYRQQIGKHPFVNVYLFKGYKVLYDSILDSYHYIPINYTKQITQKLPKNLMRTINKLQDFFGNSYKNLDIIDACLDINQEGKTIRWGSAYPVDNQYAFVLIDTSFWHGHQWCHELVHCFNTLLPNKFDSSYYFFHESMTEYLSIYFSIDNKKERDILFKNKYKAYLQSGVSEQSIFDVTSNYTTIDKGGPYGNIYLKTPYMIHCLAQNIGEKRFIYLLAQFYSLAKTKDKINFNDFELFLLSNNLPKEIWDKFIIKL